MIQHNNNKNIDKCSVLLCIGASQVHCVIYSPLVFWWWMDEYSEWNFIYFFVFFLVWWHFRTSFSAFFFTCFSQSRFFESYSIKKHIKTTFHLNTCVLFVVLFRTFLLHFFLVRCALSHKMYIVIFTLTKVISNFVRTFSQIFMLIFVNCSHIFCFFLRNNCLFDGLLTSLLGQCSVIHLIWNIRANFGWHVRHLWLSFNVNYFWCFYL